LSTAVVFLLQLRHTFYEDGSEEVRGDNS